MEKKVDNPRRVPCHKSMFEQHLKEKKNSLQKEVKESKEEKKTRIKKY